MVFDKNHDLRNRWNSLPAIELAGLSEYPGLAQLAYVPATSIDERIAVAMKAQQSLIIRLLVRRPLRTRHVCNMQIDRNLRCADGHWTIRFRARELEACILQRPSSYQMLFPKDLVPQLEEFLTVWRPMLLGSALPELFTTLAGRPYSSCTLNNAVRKTIYVHTGRATDVRQIRAIWATEFLKKTRDFVAAAEVLGDTVESVLHQNAHLHRIDSRLLADRFFALNVSSDLESRHPHGQAASRDH